MLTPTLLETLRTPEGRALVEAAAELGADPFAAEKLRRIAPLELAAAAVEQARLRKRAARKLGAAARLWLEPSLLEQASGDLPATHRARRYRAAGAEVVADLCCGLGADALALAATGMHVRAVDRDPLAVALCAANTAELGFATAISVSAGTVPAAAPREPFAWCDPGRREGGRRTSEVDTCSPSLPELLALRAAGVPHLGVKLSPAADHGRLDAMLSGVPHERELLSVRGECLELVVWLGNLASGEPRRATLLPGGHILAGAPEAMPSPERPGSYLLEPDPAVIRAGLVGNLARHLGARALEPGLAYLTSDVEVTTPFAATYAIEPPEPFSLKALAARLRALNAGDVVLKTRAAAVDPGELRGRLRAVLKLGQPGSCPVVFITRLAGRAAMVVGERRGARASEAGGG